MPSESLGGMESLSSLEWVFPDNERTSLSIRPTAGLCLSLMNGYFDAENPEQVAAKGKYYEVYDDMVAIAEKENSGKVD